MDRILLWLSRNVSLHIYDLGEEDPAEEIIHDRSANNDSSSRRTNNIVSTNTFTNPSTGPRRRRSIITLINTIPSSSTPFQSSNLINEQHSGNIITTATERLYDQVLATTHITPPLPIFSSASSTINIEEEINEQHRQQQLEAEIGEPTSIAENHQQHLQIFEHENISSQPPILALINTTSTVNAISTSSTISPGSSTTSRLLPLSISRSPSTSFVPHHRLTKKQQIQLFLLYKTCRIVTTAFMVLVWIFDIVICGWIITPSLDNKVLLIRNILTIIPTILLVWICSLLIISNYIEIKYFSLPISSNNSYESICSRIQYTSTFIAYTTQTIGYIIVCILSFQLYQNRTSIGTEFSNNLLVYSLLSITIFQHMVWIIVIGNQGFHYLYSIYNNSTISILLQPYNPVSQTFPQSITLTETHRHYLLRQLLSTIFGILGNIILFLSTIPYYVIPYWYYFGLIPSTNNNNDPHRSIHILYQSCTIVGYVLLFISSIIDCTTILKYLPSLNYSIE